MLIPGIPRLYAALGVGALILALVVGLLVTRARLDAEKKGRAADRQAVATAQAEARAADLQHARDVEAVQTRTTKEVSSAYQADLAALRARYDSLRASTAKSGGRAAPVPGIAPVSSGPDATGACEDTQLMFDAQADAIQLTAIQQLIRDLGMFEEPR